MVLTYLNYRNVSRYIVVTYHCATYDFAITYYFGRRVFGKFNCNANKKDIGRAVHAVGTHYTGIITVTKQSLNINMFINTR